MWPEEGLWHEVLVGSEAVGVAFDLDDDGMVEETVEEGSGDDVVAEYLAPFLEGAV